MYTSQEVTFLTTSRGSRASWGWSSLHAGRDIIKRERIWRLGNDSSILVHKDTWIHMKRVYTTEEIPGWDTNQAVRVDTLIGREKQWDAVRVRDCVTTSNAECILIMHMSVKEEPHKVVCPYTKDGITTIWLVYHRLREVSEGQTQITEVDVLGTQTYEEKSKKEAEDLLESEATNFHSFKIR